MAENKKPAHQNVKTNFSIIGVPIFYNLLQIKYPFILV